ncbi:MAG: PQQ-binding-like beta-propeller repeat protein [Pirellulaceae bacterium]|nr:PQQ-binding-like beta-propeller repeat protein [Pirellulaceae bacterium]
MTPRLALCLLLPTMLLPATVLAQAPGAPAAPPPYDIAETDWPWWRGPERNGIASTAANPPLEWSRERNIRWKTPIPGRGHGSPTVVGQRVFLATADHETERQSVLCFDRASGQVLWKTDVHQGGFPTKGNQKASLASSTVACDGERLFINFLNADAVHTTALDLNGQQLWQTKISDYVIHQGYGSSPCIYGPLVIVTADNKSGGAVAGLDRASGKIVWRHARPATPNYASPIIVRSAGREQLVLTGCDLVAGFAPLTGEKLWEVAGATTECVTSTVTDGQLVYTSGGYPKNHVSAVHADGSGRLAWENNTRLYVPSMLFQNGYLYAMADNGIAICWKADTGETIWRGRAAGTFSASPVLVGQRIFATNEEGTTYVYQADPGQFTLLAENQLGTSVFATPTFSGNRILYRAAEMEGDKRQEYLYCIGQAAAE